MSSWNSSQQHHDNSNIKLGGLASRDGEAAVIPVEEASSEWENGDNNTSNLSSKYFMDLSNLSVDGVIVEVEEELIRRDKEPVRKSDRQVEGERETFR